MTRLYTERNLLRSGVEKTWDINLMAYRAIFDCCEERLINLAERYPSMCQDGDVIAGVDRNRLFNVLKLRIPGLYRGRYSDSIVPSVPDSSNDDYDQFALFDYVEYIAQNMVTVLKGSWHGYWQHHHLSFRHDDVDRTRFQNEINDVFQMSGLQYVLTTKGQIERITDADGFVQQVEDNARTIPEKGLADLITEAIALYHNARPETHHLATEKIWDAFERVKTIYSSNKKESAERLTEVMANGNGAVKKLFDAEFISLKNVGNDYRIRHHEIGKIELTDSLWCDYLFVRCLALVDLAIRKAVNS